MKPQKLYDDLAKLKLSVDTYHVNLVKTINTLDYDELTKIDRKVQLFNDNLVLNLLVAKKFQDQQDNSLANIISLNNKVKQLENENIRFFKFIKNKTVDVSKLTSDEKNWIKLHAYPDGIARRLSFLDLINHTIEKTKEYEQIENDHKLNKNLLKSIREQIKKIMDFKEIIYQKWPIKSIKASQISLRLSQLTKGTCDTTDMKDIAPRTRINSEFDHLVRLYLESNKIHNNETNNNNNNNNKSRNYLAINDLIKLKEKFELLFNKSFKNIKSKLLSDQAKDLLSIKENDRKILKQRLMNSMPYQKKSIKKQNLVEINEKTFKYRQKIINHIYLPYETRELANNTNIKSPNITTKPLNYKYKELRRTEKFECENDDFFANVDLVECIRNCTSINSDDNKETNKDYIFNSTDSEVVTDTVKLETDYSVKKKYTRVKENGLSKSIKNDKTNYDSIYDKSIDKTLSVLPLEHRTSTENSEDLKQSKKKQKARTPEIHKFSAALKDNENVTVKMNSISEMAPNKEQPDDIEEDKPIQKVKSGLFEMLPEPDEELDLTSDDEKCPSKFYGTTDMKMTANIVDDKLKEEVNDNESEIVMNQEYEDYDCSSVDSLSKSTKIKLKYFVRIHHGQMNILGCVITCQGADISNITQKSFSCNAVTPDHLLPEIDLKENYSSYIIEIKDQFNQSNTNHEDLTYTISLPFKNINKESYDTVMLKYNTGSFKWQSLTSCFHSKSFIMYKSKDPPNGIYTSMSFVKTDEIVINRKGINMTCSSDSGIALDIPEYASRIPINAMLQSYKITSESWNELQNKFGQKELENIVSTSSILCFKTKRKKLAKPGHLTFYLPEPSFRSNRNTTSNETGKTHELNSFQKSLILPSLAPSKTVNDIKLLSYNHDDEKWNIMTGDEYKLNKDKCHVNATFPLLVTTKYMMIRTKLNATEESILKAVRKINDSLSYRTVCICLFKSLSKSSHFLVLMALKSMFNLYSENLKESGYTRVNGDESDIVHVELMEYQEIIVRMTGNICDSNMKNEEKREMKMRFYSLFPNYVAINAKVENKLIQRALGTYRGYVDILTTKLDPAEFYLPTQNGSVMYTNPSVKLKPSTLTNHSLHVSMPDSRLFAHFLLTVRKKDEIQEPVMFKKEHLNKLYYRNCFTVIDQLSHEIRDKWFDLGKLLGISLARLNSIRYDFECFGNQKCAKQLLVYWMKGCRNFDQKIKLLYEILSFEPKTIHCGDERKNSRILRFGC